MPREIKFRARMVEGGNTSREDVGKWSYGYYVKTNTGHQLICDGECKFELNCDDIDRSTLGQFTGLRDKNGKEIYEGDFVVLFNLKDAFFEIINHKGCFGYLISSEFVPLCGHHIRPDVIEVIGNIIENG